MRERAERPPQSTSALTEFDILVGGWDLVGTHPAFPAAVPGEASFTWLVDGALLVWHFDWERAGPPSAVAVIGHDDTGGACSVLYADERGVTRIYQMSLEGGVWQMWRDTPGFSQRVIGTICEDGNTIACHGKLSRDGSRWVQDLDVAYTRKR